MIQGTARMGGARRRRKEKMENNVKTAVCTATGVVGGLIANLFGGWNAALGALMICMAIDYITGLMVAGIFHSSPKSPNGGLESMAGWKGLARKFVTLMIVLAAHEMDVLLGINYIRDAVIIGFCANEIISILENAGLMGLPVPKILSSAIDQLKTPMGKESNEMRNEYGKDFDNF